jgi:hypothetical protein
MLSDHYDVVNADCVESESYITGHHFNFEILKNFENL